MQSIAQELNALTLDPSGQAPGDQKKDSGSGSTAAGAELCFYDILLGSLAGSLSMEQKLKPPVVDAEIKSQPAEQKENNTQPPDSRADNSIQSTDRNTGKQIFEAAPEKASVKSEANPGRSVYNTVHTEQKVTKSNSRGAVAGDPKPSTISNHGDPQEKSAGPVSNNAAPKQASAKADTQTFDQSLPKPDVKAAMKIVSRELHQGEAKATDLKTQAVKTAGLPSSNNQVLQQKPLPQFQADASSNAAPKPAAGTTVELIMPDSKPVREAGHMELSQLMCRSVAKPVAASVRVAEVPQTTNQSANENAGGEQGRPAGESHQASSVEQQPVEAQNQTGPRNFASTMAARTAAQARPATSVAPAPVAAPASTATKAQQPMQAFRPERPAPLQQQIQQPQRVLNQVVRAAQFGLKEGRDEVKLLLKPQNLGWVKVKIAVEGQKVMARILVEREGVRDLLEHNLHSLNQALQNQNLKVSNIVIELLGENEQQAKESNEGKKQNQNQPKEEEITLPDEASESAPAPAEGMAEVALVDLTA